MKKFNSKSAISWYYEARNYVRKENIYYADFRDFIREHLKNHQELTVFAVVLLMESLHYEQPLSFTFQFLVEELGCSYIQVGIYIEYVCKYSIENEENLKYLKEEFEFFFISENHSAGIGWLIDRKN